MNILIIGQGGREHALVHSFKTSSSIKNLHIIPGNDGMTSSHSSTIQCHKIDWKDSGSLVQFCFDKKIDFVFIGPEDPLVGGLSDILRREGISVVGPSQAAAQLEGSKVFSKQFMLEAKIPTSKFSVVTDVTTTLKESENYTPPYVLKADGLCAGKGVFICKTKEILQNAAQDLFEKKIFGEAGKRAVLEQFLPGWELSYLVVTNGKDFQTLPLAQDHKRLLDKDEGPNTGGMGAVAPILIDQNLDKEIRNNIVKRTLDLLDRKNYLYRGVLYFGLMITSQGPHLLEYNCRFGDPETQVILPLLDEDTAQLFKSIAEGKLPPIKIKNETAAACVVMAAPGYPTNPKKDLKIKGDPTFFSKNAYFIHAGTKKNNDSQWLTSGGRVLCSIGIGKNIKEALKNSYDHSKNATWEGLQMRQDIGSKESLTNEFQ